MSLKPVEREVPAPSTATSLPGHNQLALSPAQAWLRRLPLLPALIFMLLVTQVPFLLTLYYSFQRWILVRPRSRGFVGLANYQEVLTDPHFGTAVLNTVIMSAGAVFLSLLMGLLLAILLDRRVVGRSAARTLLITPMLVMPAASALVWKTSILDPTNGIVNWILGPFGGGDIAWASKLPMLTVIIFLVWQWTPFMMLILLAGLQAQPTDILESASVDGAGPWGVFRFLTWPHMRPYLELSTILGSIYIIQTFDPVFLITQGGPGSATTNLPYYLYLETFRAGDIGVSSAAGVLTVIATIILATLALRLVASVFREGGGR